jgi:hypothetical protein
MASPGSGLASIHLGPGLRHLEHAGWPVKIMIEHAELAGRTTDAISTEEPAPHAGGN